MARWEYLSFSRWRDPQFLDDAYKYWVQEPGDEEPREIEVPGKDGSSFLDAINRLGDLGWELVGPPEENKVAMTYKNRRDHYMNYADWSSQRFLFKRPRS